VSSSSFADGLGLTLVRAGIKLKPSEFVGIVSLAVVGAALVAALISGHILSELVAAAIAFAICAGYVRILQLRRLAAFNKQLPDAISLMSSALRSGYSFTRAMQMISEEMPQPISEEFARVINEVNVGLPTDAALMRMVARVRSYDLELVAIAIIIQQQVGGNLAEIVDNIGGTIRDRVRVNGEMSALTAEGRISGVILVLLPFAIAGLILVVNPGYLNPLIEDVTGKALILIGLVMQAIGALIIKRMLVLDY
jgi:tight adherence protein B